MFYSKDLLSRRSPLGAIWTIAHGKKLSKNKLLGISVQEICNEILHPDVPHSLRLQGILIGGVVVVFNKQTHYLLEDLQEMMRRVKDAIRVESGGAEQATLQHGKDKAKREAITLVDHDSGLAAEDAMLYNIDLNNLLVPSLANPAMVLFTQHRPARSMSLGGFQDAELFAVPTQSGYTKSGLTQSVGRQTGGQEVTGGRQALLGGHGGDGADYAEQDEVFGDVGEMMMGGLLDDEAMGLGMHMDLGMLGMADPTAQAKASSMVGSENAAEASSPDGAVENRLNNNNAAARKARGSDASMAVEEGAMEVEDGLGAAEDRMDLVGRKRKPSGEWWTPWLTPVILRTTRRGFHMSMLQFYAWPSGQRWIGKPGAEAGGASDPVGMS
ncbi:Rec8 like protein-domain-containing protein [Haematococcus lacustris]